MQLSDHTDEMLRELVRAEAETDEFGVELFSRFEPVIKSITSNYFVPGANADKTLTCCVYGKDFVFSEGEQCSVWSTALRPSRHTVPNADGDENNEKDTRYLIKVFSKIIRYAFNVRQFPDYQDFYVLLMMTLRSSLTTQRPSMP